MGAYHYMFISILLWSVFPLFFGMGLRSIDPFLFIAYIQFFAGITAAVFGFYLIRERQRLVAVLKIMIKKLTLNQFAFILATGFASISYSLCFAYAMILAPQISATLILEIWPIHAVYLSYFLIKKDWSPVDREDTVIGLLAIIGFIIIILGTQTTPDIQSFDFKAVFGCFLALLGAISLALSVLMRARIGQEVETHLSYQKNSEKKLIASIFIGEFIARLATIPFLLFIFSVFDVTLTFHLEQILMSAFIGILIFNIGSATYSLATLKSSSPTIHLSWFMMCVLSVLWLHLAGQDKVNITVFMGMACIISANIVLVIKNMKPKTKKTAV